MRKFFNKFLSRFSFRVEWPGNMFDLSPGSLRYTPSDFDYPSTVDAWRGDWANICSDFRNAFDRLKSEVSH